MDRNIAKLLKKQNKNQNTSAVAEGWGFTKTIEIIKCKEGNKEFMRECSARKPFESMYKICEYSFEAMEVLGYDGLAVWKLAKRAARDFLRVSCMKSAIITFTKIDKVDRTVIVYGKY